jgi:hypothetical protein
MYKKLIFLLALNIAHLGLFADEAKASKEAKEAEASSWKDAFFEKYPEADKNKDGVLTWYELKKFKEVNPNASAWIKK